MRRFMAQIGDWVPQYVPKRKQPLYYWHPLCRGLAVLGHYETDCGGCDTIGSARQVYELIMSLEGITTVVCEGLILSEDVKWSCQLPNLKCLFLTTPTEECVKRVKKRRKAAGNDKPLNETNTVKRVAVIERARKRLIDLDIFCRRCSSEQAPGLIMKYINVVPQYEVPKGKWGDHVKSQQPLKG